MSIRLKYRKNKNEAFKNIPVIGVKCEVARISEIENNIANQSREIEEVKAKVGQAVANTIDTPFTTAYWKDSNTNKIYLVKVENGVLTLTENGGGNEEDISGLEDLLPDRLLIWHDEFDGDVLDESKWEKQYTDSVRSNSYYTAYAPDEMYEIKDSILVMKAVKGDFVEPTTNTVCNAKISQIRSSTAFRFGTWQFKMRWDGKPRTWSAFWLMGNGAPWCFGGEIDIIETGMNNNATTNSPTSLHFANDVNNTHSNVSIGNCTFSVNTWHDVQFTLKQNGTVTLVIDDVTIFEDISLENKAPTSYLTINDVIYNPWTMQDKYITLDTYIWNASDDTQSEHKCEFDYVRFYALDTIIQRKEVDHYEIEIMGNNESSDFIIDKSKCVSTKNGIIIPIAINAISEDGELLGYYPIATRNNTIGNITSSDENVITISEKLLNPVVISDGSSVITYTDKNGKMVSRKITIASNISTGTKKSIKASELELTQFKYYNADTGERVTTTTTTVYSTDLIDVTTWGRNLQGVTSNNSLGGVFISEFDKDGNHLGRTTLYSNNGTGENGNMTLQDETAKIGITLTGYKTSYEYTFKYSIIE